MIKTFGTYAFIFCFVCVFSIASVYAGPIAPRPGGFTLQDTDNKDYGEIVRTAEKLMNEKYPGRDIKITMITRVYTQVVSGINYKLICSYSDTEGEGDAEIVVYEDLKGNKSILRDNYRINRNVFLYETTFGGRIKAEFLKEDKVKLDWGKGIYILDIALSGSGARYTGDSLTFWIKGDSAFLENEKTLERVNCEVKE